MRLIDVVPEALKADHKYQALQAKATFQGLKQVKASISHLPELDLPNDAGISVWRYEIDIAIAWNLELEQRIQQAFVEAGWMITSHRSYLPDNPKVVTIFIHNTYCRVELTMVAKENPDQNTTQKCRLILLGKQTVTREEPIYEVICEEGAAEMEANGDNPI